MIKPRKVVSAMTLPRVSPPYLQLINWPESPESVDGTRFLFTGSPYMMNMSFLHVRGQKVDTESKILLKSSRTD